MKNITIRIISLLTVILLLVTSVPYADISAVSEEKPLVVTVTDTAVDSSATGISSNSRVSFFTRAVYSGSYGAQLSNVAKEYYDAMVSEFAVKKNTGEFSFALSSPITFRAEFSNGAIVSNDEYEAALYTLSAALQMSLDAFLYDHPEVFWLRSTRSSYSISISGGSGSMKNMRISTIKITPTEIYSGASAKLSQYNSAVNSALDAITVSDSRYDTLKNIHDYICNNAYYAYGNSNYYVHSSESFFLRDGGVVCEGYAKAFKVICDRLGIPCALIVGDAGGAHMWNYVQMDDGKWYLIDATWDDQQSGIYYTYFIANSNTVGFDGVKISDERSAENDFSGMGYFGFTYPVLSAAAYTVHIHQWDSDYTVDAEPTCTEKGSKSIHCTTCTATKNVTEIPALTHSWTAATCNVAKTCNTCGATEGSPLGHDYTSAVTKAATCTADGIRTYTCKRCTDSYTENISKLAHTRDSGRVTKFSTCTEKGLRFYSCSVCKTVLFTEELPLTEHNWQNATCTVPKKCGACGLTDGDAYGHSYTSTVTKAVTCTENGIMTYSCVRAGCSDSYTETVAAKGHLWKDANCVSPKSCRNCGITDGEAEGHNYEASILKEATCTESGIRAYTCTGCTDGYNETILPKGHSWTSATCNVAKTCNTCGATEGEPLGHDYTSAVTTAATCTVNGVRTYSCTRCAYGYTEAIPMTAHINDGGAVTKQPTCTVKGTKTYKCTECKTVLKTETVSAKGHTYIYHEAKAPTCTENGWSEYRTCESCDYTTYEETSALGHIDTDVNNICDICNVMLGEIVEPDNHIAGDINGDKTVNNKDLNRLMRYLAGDGVNAVENALDVNGDSKINNKDLNRLMRYLAGDSVEMH